MVKECIVFDHLISKRGIQVNKSKIDVRKVWSFLRNVSLHCYWLFMLDCYWLFSQNKYLIFLLINIVFHM